MRRKCTIVGPDNHNGPSEARPTWGCAGQYVRQSHRRLCDARTLFGHRSAAWLRSATHTGDLKKEFLCPHFCPPPFFPDRRAHFAHVSFACRQNSRKSFPEPFMCTNMFFFCENIGDLVLWARLVSGLILFISSFTNRFLDKNTQSYHIFNITQPQYLWITLGKPLLP